MRSVIRCAHHLHRVRGVYPLELSCQAWTDSDFLRDYQILDVLLLLTVISARYKQRSLFGDIHPVYKAALRGVRAYAISFVGNRQSVIRCAHYLPSRIWRTHERSRIQDHGRRSMASP